MSIQPAPLQFRSDGTPFSPVFDDVYHSADGGPDQSREVFLHGNNLPTAWQGQAVFTVLETGFGPGLNFLTTLAAWRADPQRCQRLHFISVEKFPFTRDSLQYLHAQWPGFAREAADLQARWPVLTPGFHRLTFDEGRVVLTLLLGDAQTLLPQLTARVDAFYLDGFSPAKNPELWSPALFRTLARLARPQATLATYTSAGFVRRGLIDAGFAVERRPGFGGKRQMLGGVYARQTPVRQPCWSRQEALVIGAGLAGAAAAERLAARGWQVTVLERESAPAQRASGNHVGVLLPVLSLDDNLQARLARTGFLYALSRFAELPTFEHGQCGVLQLARDDEQAALQRRVIETAGFPEGYARWMDAAEASALAGARVPTSGWWFAQGSWIHPPAYCRSQLNAHGPLIRVLTRAAVAQLERDPGSGDWVARDAAGTELARAPVAIIANATDALHLAQTASLPLSNSRRVVTLLPETTPLAARNIVICRNAYLTPTLNGLRVLGATEAPAGAEAGPHWHAANLDKLGRMLPGQQTGFVPDTLTGRGCDRPSSPDRLPLVGPLPAAGARFDVKPVRIARAPGLYCALGFGARGLAWGALAGELLASQICGEPLPVERDLAEACDPARFGWRAARQLAREKVKS